MNQIFQRRSFLIMPFLLGLFFFASLININAQINPTSVTIYGVTTSNQLVRFNAATPGTVTTVGTISGLQAGENILGIDFRPATGQLYALGSSGRLYTINLTNGAATQVGAAFTLTGTDFGFDFNPTVDRIRVTSNTGQNLRLNPNDGTVTVDPNLNPGTPSVTASGYTNNFAGSTTTTLFDIDSATDRLLQQNPANAGTLVDVGALGIDVSGVNGFDIVSRGPSSGFNLAYAALTVNGVSGLYTINLATGATTLVATLPTTLRALAISFGSPASKFLDFDGDNRTDFAVFRLSTSTFFVQSSTPGNTSFFGLPFGNSQTDVLAPGDYDGDGLTDIGVYRREGNLGTFFVRNTATGAIQNFQFGVATDQPVPRDYDGDGRTDFAVVRRTPGPNSATRGTLTWFIQQSSTNTMRSVLFGFDTDVPVPGDYDGDGRFDIAVFRTEADGTGTFYVLQLDGSARAVRFGFGSDLVVPGDYDGDGRTDFAVLRQGTQFQWFILRSTDNMFYGVTFGEKPQLPAPGDYDGDGRTDIAVFDPRSSLFFVLQSSNGTVLRRAFGQNGDIPLASINVF